ncbi:MAG: hypothetical protein ACHREM_06585 [Polyangiales bacterium]
MAVRRIGRIDVEDLVLGNTVEHGKLFVTGHPVTFDFGHNTEKSPHFGAAFGQDIEPAGYYMIQVAPNAVLSKGWLGGSCHLRSPLVLQLSIDPDKIYGPTGWKARLHKATKKKGDALSHQILALGFDGIVTVTKSGTSEIVALRPGESLRSR